MLSDLTVAQRRALTTREALRRLAMMTGCDKRTIRLAILGQRQPIAANARLIEDAIPAVLATVSP